MTRPTHNFDNLWNDLPFEERARLMPHMVESQKLHIWQCKQEAINAHNAHMKTLNDWLKSIDSELTKMVAMSEKVEK
jgi:hypothetical protein